jgi:hypothetical protein
MVSPQLAFFSDGKPSCNDFVYYWVSGALAGSVGRALVYDVTTFSAARSALGAADACLVPVLNQFVYPPTYLFFPYPLGLMHYVAAFAAWTAVTLLLYLGVIYLIYPSDRYSGGAFTIPCVLQSFSRTEWIPPRRVDGIVPRLDGATASIIRHFSWPADF